MIDFGAGTTSLSIYQEGDLIHAAVFPVGSENITNDIAIGLRTEPDVAEKVKIEYGTVAARGRKIEKIETKDGSRISFSPTFLSRIIEARIKQIFQLVSKELKQSGKQGMLPAGIVLCGGGSKLPALAEFAKRELKLSVKIGTSEGIVGFPEDPAFVALMGLLLCGMEMAKADRRNETFRIAGSLKKLFKPFLLR